MKTIPFLLLSLFLQNTSFAADDFIGKWKGYCDALGPKESTVGTYEFKSDKTAVWTAEFFNNLRCQGTPVRTSVTKLTFTSEPTDKKTSGERIVTFKNKKDLSTEKDVIKVEGDLLSIWGMELNVGGKTMKGSIGPIHFVREK